MGADQPGNREWAMMSLTPMAQRSARSAAALASLVCALTLAGAAQQENTSQPLPWLTVQQMQPDGSSPHPDVFGRVPGAYLSTGPIEIWISATDSDYVSDSLLDTSGGFLFNNVPPGDYVLMVTHPGGILGVRALRLPSNRTPFFFQIGKAQTPWGLHDWPRLQGPRCVRSLCLVDLETRSQ
jgi:hypothetical protein